MISYAEAMALIAGLPRAVGIENVPLAACAGRTLAQAVYAPFASPPFTNSAMDGYAVRHGEACKGPLAVSGSIYARAHALDGFERVPSSACARIMTGAPLPVWADTVVPVEKTTEEAGYVNFRDLPAKGANVRHEAEDICTGALLLEAGSILTAERLLVMANFGFEVLPVYEKPAVGILSTGDELVPLGEALPPGGIYNATGVFLDAAFSAIGLSPGYRATLGDDEVALGRAAEHFFGGPSMPRLFLTTGAVSAGEKDFIPALAAQLGFTPLFHKVAIRPGKPLYVGRREPHELWVGIPGNPVSTMVAWHFFLRPLLAIWAGIPKPPILRAPLIRAVEKPKGLRCFFRGAFRDNGVEVFKGQGSAQLLASLSANAYIVLPEADSIVNAGTIVEVLLL